MDTMMETRKKSLEYYTFPGFCTGEFIELPAQLEAPPILHRVTTAQDFNVSFEQEKKLKNNILKTSLI